MRLPVTLILALAALPVLAERADRDKPIHIEADKVTVDDRKGVQIFEGHVTMTQGTLTIQGAKVIVSQDDDGYQKGVAYGSSKELARFRQKRDGVDEWVDGHAERIEHDARTEETRFYNQAFVKSGEDQVRGQYIQFNGLTQQYYVTGGPAAPAGSVASTDNRVRAVIQPKNKKSPAPAGEGATPAPADAAPRQE